MSTQHKDLTGAELHEPKGVAAAGSGTVYEADGSGSGSWVDPLRNLNNKNLLVATSQITDISTPSDYCIIPAPSQACKVVNVAVTVMNNTTGSPSVLSAEIISAGQPIGAGVATDLSLSCPAGSGVHATFTGAVTSNNSLTSSQAVLVKTDGGSAGVSVAHVVVTFDVS